jgi:PIN domain nuclease of toxin-antitoxin system
LYAQLLVKVRPGLPHVEFDSNLKEKLKAVMEKQYNCILKALDLSRFHADPGERMVIRIQNTHLPS